MILQNQFYIFYRSYLKKISQIIRDGKISIFVGINTIGKTLFTEQLMSKRFREEFLQAQKTHLVLLDFKDKPPPTSKQLYRYWLMQTAKTTGQKLDQNEDFNDYIFSFQMSEIIKNLKGNEKIVFILLDAQRILDQPESFFTSLTYLYIYSYGKISYIFLSEPHILECDNPGVQRFTQRFTDNNFIFLKNFDTRTSLADIERQSQLLGINFQKYKSLILRYSKGLHGVIRTFCYLLKDNPGITNIRQLMKIAYNDKFCQMWVKEVLDSLPAQSVRILREIILEKERFKTYHKDLYCKWLVDLGFLKKKGTFRYPLMLPILNQYSPLTLEKAIPIKLLKNRLFLQGEETILPKNEFIVLQILYKSKGKLVTYDQIGEILWKDDPNKFSLWAISQIISRLRKKLSSYSINPKIISSQRGEGYILH